MYPSDIEREGFLASRLQVAQEAAAGGVCSMRVLNLMHDIDERSKSNDSIMLYIPCDEIDEGGRQYMTVLGGAEVASRIVLAADRPTVEDETKTQNIFLVDKRSKKALHLWKLIEEPANSEKCSRSIFWPALTDDELDWSQVVTGKDEDSAISAEESLKQEPLTNAKVLDMLIDCIGPESDTETLTELLKLIKAPDLWQRHVQDVNPFSENNYISSGPLPDFLYQDIAGRIAWLGSSGATYRSTTSPKSGPGNLVFLLDPAKSTDHLEVIAEFPDLGSNGPRQSMLGRLVVNETMTSNPQFFTINDEETSSAEALEVARYAASAFEVPQFIRDEELLNKIGDILKEATRKQLDLEDLELIMKKLLKEKAREQRETNLGIDLGEIDIRDLGEMDFLSRLPEGVYRATIYANNAQNVFTELNNGVTIYDSKVFGAKLAFVGNGKNRLGPIFIRNLASGCEEAFGNVGKSKYCVAANAPMAFLGYGSFQGNYAENCGVAFSSRFLETEYIDNVAKGGNKVFHTADNVSMRGNTAIGKYKWGKVLRGGTISLKKRNGNKIIRR